MTIFRIKPAPEQHIINSNNMKDIRTYGDVSTDHTSQNLTDSTDNDEISINREKLDHENDRTVRGLWREFRENTTMHGLKHARRDDTYRLRWVIWIVALMGMGSLLIYTLYKLFAYYRTNPTLTNIKVQFVKEMVYPTITICNMSPYKKSAINASGVMSKYLLHSSRLGVLLPPLNYSDQIYDELKNPLPKDWLDKVSLTIDDLFINCVNERKLVNCHDILNEKMTQWGKCFSFNSDLQRANKRQPRVNGSMTGTATALTFYLDIKQDEYVFNSNMAAGVKVVLHDHEEEPDIINQGFILSPGLSTYISMKMTKYKHLPAPYTAGGDRYCVNTKAPEYVNTLKYYPVYSRSACLLECRRNYIVGQCGCQAITDPGNETLCTLAEAAKCYYQNEVYFDSNGELKENCQCRISCEYSTFDHSISSAVVADILSPALAYMGHTDVKRNNIEVRLYYDSLSFLSVESIPEYNMEDVVGILGGQMGIFLGASLLTVSELLEFVILTLVLLGRKMFSFFKRDKDARVVS